MKTKLQLNKKTVSELSSTEMENVKGGFTYSLSLGSRCKNSKSLGADSQFECGQLIIKQQQERLDSLNNSN